MTCCRARRRASAPRASRGAFCISPSPRSTSIPATDPYDRAVYAKAAENLQRMIKAGVLMRDATPYYYVYRLTWRDRVQTGLAAVASIADYTTNRVRKHELTTPVKEDDRVRQIEAVNAQTGPVMIGYPHAPAIDAMLDAAATGRRRGRRHRRRRRAPPDVGGGRRADHRRADQGLQRAAGDLHRRRASPFGRGRRGSRRRAAARPARTAISSR